MQTYGRKLIVFIKNTGIVALITIISCKQSSDVVILFASLTDNNTLKDVFHSVYSQSRGIHGSADHRSTDELQ
jgi:hypothetical protein